MNRSAVCIVWFHPSAEQQLYFTELLPFFSRIYLLDNTPTPVGLPAGWREDTRLHYVPFRENVGIAQALNRALALAYEEDQQWLLTLDQDSRFARGSLESLLKLTEGEPAADLGLYAAQLDTGFTPPFKDSKARLLRSAWTSGNLVAVKSARTVGGWDNSFFIDMVDHDFCRKLRKAGYQLLLCPTIRLIHSLGESQKTAVMTLTHHSPLRRYYITRNSLIFIARYRRDFPAEALAECWHLAKQTFKVLGFEQQRRNKFRMILRGIWDFLRDHRGPFQP